MKYLTGGQALVLACCVRDGVRRRDITAALAAEGFARNEHMVIGPLLERGYLDRTGDMHARSGPNVRTYTTTASGKDALKAWVDFGIRMTGIAGGATELPCR